LSNKKELKKAQKIEIKASQSEDGPQIPIRRLEIVPKHQEIEEVEQLFDDQFDADLSDDKIWADNEDDTAMDFIKSENPASHASNNSSNALPSALGPIAAVVEAQGQVAEKSATSVKEGTAKSPCKLSPFTDN
jgi:hypothetical protein